MTRTIGIRNGNGGVIGQFGKGLGGIVTFITHFKKKTIDHLMQHKQFLEAKRFQDFFSLSNF